MNELQVTEVENEEITCSSYADKDGDKLSIYAEIIGHVVINGKRYKFDDSIVMDLTYIGDVEE